MLDNSTIASTSYPVMEHFYTIQGEGYHQGRAAYFVRLGGCDVGCVWCDVKESWDGSKFPQLSAEEITAIIKQTPAQLVVITGGEPLMSGYTWQLIDWFKANKGRSHTRLAINSNLGMEWEVVQRLLDSCEGIELDVYNSMESIGPHAEYIRDGLDYTQWTMNMERIMKSNKIRALHVMCTINALCLESLPEFLTYLLLWKSQYGADFPNFTLNILRFPSFQSPLVLPDSIRMRHRDRLQAWLDQWQHHMGLQPHEINHVKRLIDYLDVVKTPHSDAFDQPALYNDFRQFYQQYDQRRGKDFCRTFPNLVPWYESISV